MTEETAIELIQDVAGLKATVASIEGKLDDLARKLLGNGRKGMIDEMGDRVSSLERYRAWVIGSAAGVAGVVTILAWIVMASK